MPMLTSDVGRILFSREPTDGTKSVRYMTVGCVGKRCAVNSRSIESGKPVTLQEDDESGADVSTVGVDAYLL